MADPCDVPIKTACSWPLVMGWNYLSQIRWKISSCRHPKAAKIRRMKGVPWRRSRFSWAFQGWCPVMSLVKFSLGCFLFGGLYKQVVHVRGSKLPILGLVIPPLVGILIIGIKTPTIRLRFPSPIIWKYRETWWLSCSRRSCGLRIIRESRLFFLCNNAVLQILPLCQFKRNIERLLQEVGNKQQNYDEVINQVYNIYV